MKVLNLGKKLKNPQDTGNLSRLPDHELAVKSNSLLIAVSSDIIDSFSMAKSIIEEYYIQQNDVAIIDNSGYLSSTGLVFDPDNTDEIALSIPYSKGEFPELKALEFSAKFKEQLDTFGVSSSFENFHNSLKFFLLFEGFEGHRVVYNTPFTLDFLKSKDFAMNYFELYANFLNESSNPAIVQKDISFVKYLVGIVLKQNIQLKNLNDLFDFLESFKTFSDKLKVPADELEKFVNKTKARFTKYRDFYFSGIQFTEELITKLSKFQSIISYYISKHFDQTYKELETLIVLKKILNLTISNYNKEMLLVLDMNGLANLITKFKDNFDILSNYSNITWLLVMNESDLRSTPELMEKAAVIYYQNLKEISDLPFVKGNTFGEKTKNGVSFFVKRPNFSITKEITEMDIPKMKIPEEFYSITGMDSKKSGIKIYRLIIQDGPLSGKEILLSGKELMFGRNEFFPTNKLISRRHFKLSYENGHYFIYDASVNGTFVNNQKINKSVLSDNDTIVIGNNEVTILFKET